MLIWVNGAFGGGKTQTAHELQRRLPGSVICDPEFIGFGLHRTSPPALRGDFQDLVSWRLGVREVLDLALTGQPGTVIAPMTLTDPTYFAEILGWLRDQGHDVRHFALLADRETVKRRLYERGFGHLVRAIAGRDAPLRRETFALARLEECLERLAKPDFGEHLWNDILTVPQVADRIAASCGLTLLPNNDTPAPRTGTPDACRHCPPPAVMSITTVAATGTTYLELVTRLLQRSRLADPDGGAWEAADLQWAWRVDQHADPGHALFWLKDAEPVAAIVLQRWRPGLEFYVLRHPSGVPSLQAIWAEAATMLASIREPVELAIRADDLASAAHARGAGFVESDEVYHLCARSATDLPTDPPPEGIRIVSRVELADRDHHMVGRNGPEVAERLAETSLYRPDLDLVALTAEDEIAGVCVVLARPGHRGSGCSSQCAPRPTTRAEGSAGPSWSRGCTGWPRPGQRA